MSVALRTVTIESGQQADTEDLSWISRTKMSLPSKSWTCEGFTVMQITMTVNLYWDPIDKFLRVLSVCDWVCVHNFRPEVFLFESMSALNIYCPKTSERYLSGSPMCLASHGMIEVMLMQTLTKTFLAWKHNIPGLRLRGSEIGFIRF